MHINQVSLIMEPTSEICGLDIKGKRNTSTAKSAKKESDTCVFRDEEKSKRQAWNTKPISGGYARGRESYHLL